MMIRPPVILTLEEEETRFYAAIGKTMMQWQAVETSLSNIFCALVGPPGNSGLANIAFYSVESFRAKLVMTNNVVTTRFSFIPDRISEWPTLAKRTNKRSDRRNASPITEWKLIRTQSLVVDTAYAPHQTTCFRT